MIDNNKILSIKLYYKTKERSEIGRN